MKHIKAILIGSYGLMTDSLISRLNQESCEVFVITGDKSKEEKHHRGVIEVYPFEYDNINIPYILESTKADAVIFMGAWDTGFLWNNQGDGVTYLGGLYNILLSAVKANIKKFIYLSLTEIYEKAEVGSIDENDPQQTTGLREKTMVHGENLVIPFHNDNGMQVAVLRCAEVYGSFHGLINQESFCTRLCMDMLKGNQVITDNSKMHDFVHFSDATEAIYKVLTMEDLPHNIYHICSGNGIPESRIANIISMVLGISKAGENPEAFDYKKSELSCEPAINELGLRLTHTSEESFIQYIQQVIEFENRRVNRKTNLFMNIKKNLKTIFGWFYPYLETVAVFVGIEVMKILLGDSSYLQAIDFYLLYVVFIAIIYGKGQTIVAILFSMVGKMNLYHREDIQSFNEIVVNYNIYLWLLHLLIIGMGIGYIRDHYKQTIGDKEEEIKYLKAELTEVKEINQSNIRIKNIYEGRLINYQDSFARIYSIISRLSDLEPDQILFAAIGVVSQIMNSDEVVLYHVDHSGAYARLAASSEQIKNDIKKSIQLYELKDVYEEIRRKRIYVNRTMENNKPSMAGGVYHEDKLETIVIIRSLPFENTTLYHMNLFSVVLNLIAQALHRANYHIEEIKGIRYLENTSILTSKAFHNMIEIKKRGFDTNLAEFSVLEIKKEGRSLNYINDIVVPVLRQQDYLGLGEDDRLFILLSNTSEGEADIVIQRLLAKGIETRKEAL